MAWSQVGWSCPLLGYAELVGLSGPINNDHFWNGDDCKWILMAYGHGQTSVVKPILT